MIMGLVLSASTADLLQIFQRIVSLEPIIVLYIHIYNIYNDICLANEYATNDTFCLACPLGKYCETAGLSSPTGDCSPGYYCSGGGQVPEPTSVATQGGAICEMKNYCPRGAKHLTLCKLLYIYIYIIYLYIRSGGYICLCYGIVQM